jgi:hypothetical protein
MDDAEIAVVIMPLLQDRQMAQQVRALDRRLIELVKGNATCRTLVTMPARPKLFAINC